MGNKNQATIYQSYLRKKMKIQEMKSMPCIQKFKTALLLISLVSIIAADCSAFTYSDLSTGCITTRKQRLSKTTCNAERQPWNLFQFVQQSSRFINFFPSSKQLQKQLIKPGNILWKAGASTNEFTFAPLDDVVMGGASSSKFKSSTGTWEGQVTDANNGGFVGIRSSPYINWDMSQCQGIEVQLRNRDNNPIQLKVVLRDSTQFNGVSWTTSRDIVNKRKSVKIPFSKQIPTIFAKTVSGQTFSKETVKGIQLVYSKFEYDGALNPKFSLGDFQIQVEEIRAY